MTRLGPATLLCCALALSCQGTDLARPCALFRSNPDGGSQPVPVRGGDLPPGARFVSIAAECDHQLCARDPTAADDAGAPLTGYCTRYCGSGEPCQASNGANLTCQTFEEQAGGFSELLPGRFDVCLTEPADGG